VGKQRQQLRAWIFARTRERESEKKAVVGEKEMDIEGTGEEQRNEGRE